MLLLWTDVKRPQADTSDAGILQHGVCVCDLYAWQVSQVSE